MRSESREDETLFEGVTKRTLLIGKEVTLAEIRYNAFSSSTTHRHPDEHLGYVITGKLSYNSKRLSATLRAGDVFFTPAMQPHSIKALEDSLVIEACSSSSWRVIQKTQEWGRCR